MSNQELVNYIKQSLAQGYAKEQIKSALLKEGWAETDIEEGFKAAGSASESSVADSGAKLIGVNDLLKKSSEFYQKNFLKIIAILGLPYLILLFLLVYFIPGVSSIGFMAAFANRGPTAVFSFIWIYLVLIIAYTILYIWASIALFYFIKDHEENIGVIEAYKRGLKKWLSYVWVNIIVGLVMLGISILFLAPAIVMTIGVWKSAPIYFTNLIFIQGYTFIRYLSLAPLVPMVITVIWVIFAPYVLVWENKKGFSVLLRSREIVRGYWWGVFARILLILAFLFAVGFAVSIVSPLFGNATIENIIKLLLSILASSFVVCYGYFIYDSLVKIKGPDVITTKKTWFRLTFIAGVAAILFSVILSFIVLGSLNKAKLRAQDAAIKMALIEMRSRAEMDFDINGDFSAACAETGGATGNSVIAYMDIAANITNNGGSGVCNESADEKSWVAWSKLAGNKYWCVDSSGSSRELNTEPSQPSQGSVHCSGVPR